MKLKGVIIAVLDIDSIRFERFDQNDQIGLESIVQMFEKSLTASEHGLKKSQLI